MKQNWKWASNRCRLLVASVPAAYSAATCKTARIARPSFVLSFKHTVRDFTPALMSSLNDLVCIYRVKYYRPQDSCAINPSGRSHCRHPPAPRCRRYLTPHRQPSGEHRFPSAAQDNNTACASPRPSTKNLRKVCHTLAKGVYGEQDCNEDSVQEVSL